MRVSYWLVALVYCALAAAPCLSWAQEDGSDAAALPVRIDAVEYRPAVWETEHVHEPDNERVNRGGMLNVFVTNTGEDTVRLRHWFMNRTERASYILSHDVAWDRKSRELLPPGEMAVIEICGVSSDFAEGKSFDLGIIDGDWQPCAYYEGVLSPSAVQVSFMRVSADRKMVEVHLRYQGSEPLAIEDIELVGKPTRSVEWQGQTLSGTGQAIARIDLETALTPGERLIAKTTYRQGEVPGAAYAHRRAFADHFPVGTWSSGPDRYGLLQRHHIDTVVQGGTDTHPFFQGFENEHSLRALAPTELTPHYDRLQTLNGHPAVSAWLITDEPDWSTPPAVVELAERIARRHGTQHPTFITLCRNVKFFEYAGIPDIPCQDHYCVAAPTSSEWPYPWGTRLEETAYYTRDLKAASEPKPIWVWTQAIANWDGRPKRNVPNPGEIAAQLLLNLGRGAKGILWFNFEMDLWDAFPDAFQAVQEWGRVMQLVKHDVLLGEPLVGEIAAPDFMDAAALLAWDRMVLCLTDVGYEMRDDGYRWQKREDLSFQLTCPQWLDPKAAVAVTPDAVQPLEIQVLEGSREGMQSVRFTMEELEVGAMVLLLPNEDQIAVYQERFAQLQAAEQAQD